MIARISLPVALSLALLCPALALAPPAPLPKPPRPLLPEPPPFYRGMPFDGQPGEYYFIWLCRFPFPREGRTYTRTLGMCVHRATLGRDHSWKAEPGGWRGGWEWNKKTRTLSVRETSGKGARFDWRATFLFTPYDGVVYEAAGAPRISIDPHPVAPRRQRP
jgi:hypothetical protein